MSSSTDAYVVNRLYINELSGHSIGDVTCLSDFALDSSQKLKSTGTSDISIVPAGTGITIIGDAGATSNFGTPTSDDLFVTGRLEVDGKLYADTDLHLTQTLYLGTTASYPSIVNSSGIITMRLNQDRSTDFFRGECYSSFRHTASSGTQSIWSLLSKFDHSGTAGYNVYHCNITEDATGSGDRNLACFQIASATKFRVDHVGQVTQGAPTTAPTLDNAQLSFYIDEGNHDLKCSVKYSDGTAKTATLAFD